MSAARAGASRGKTGSITASTASVIVFNSPCSFVIVSNGSASPLYIKFNDSVSSPVVSNTVYDVVVPSNSYPLFLEDNLKVENIGVWCAANTNIGIAGW